MAVCPGADDAHHAGDPVQGRAGHGVDGLLDAVLHLRVEVGLDQIAVAGDVVLADPRAGQVLQHVVAVEPTVAGGDAALGQRRRLRQDAQRLLARQAQFVGLVRQVVDHGVQHQVASGQRGRRVGVRVERTGRLDHSGQQRGLLPVEVGGVDPEVGLGRVLHAV